MEDGTALRALRSLVAQLMAARPCARDGHRAPPGLVAYHGLAPLCSDLGCSSYAQAKQQAAAVALHRGVQLEALRVALREARVPVALLKGVSYAERLYPDPALRPMDDIDLLVSPGRLRDAIDAGRRIGYRIRRGDGAPPSAPIHHAVALDHEDWPCPVDLHHALTGPYRSRLHTAALWRRTVPVPDTGTLVRRLHPVDELLAHLVHMARSGFMVRAISFVDAARMLQGMSDERADALRVRARAFRLSRVVRAALAVVRMFRDDEARVRNAPAGASLPSAEEILAAEDPPPARHHLRQALLADTPIYAWGYVCQHLRVIDSPGKWLDWRRRVAARRGAPRVL